MAEPIIPQVEAVHASLDFGRFHVEPLERGFGLTLGNALRRVLLSSLPGAAVTAVRIDGVYHEFASIPGVKEDSTELILNLKQLRLRCHVDEPVPVRLQATGPGVVTAADLIHSSDVEVINPELHLATLDSPDARLELELTVEKGAGYTPSDGREPSALGVIPIDSVFTPVRRVNYLIENTRVGSRTDLDRLILEIQTDGTITPSEALSQSGKILIDYFSIVAGLQQPIHKVDRTSLVTGTVPTHVIDMPIESLDLSARTYNCLKRSGVTKVGQLLQMTEDDLLALRNFGQKSLVELRDRLRERGIESEVGGSPDEDLSVIDEDDEGLAEEDVAELASPRVAD